MIGDYCMTPFAMKGIMFVYSIGVFIAGCIFGFWGGYSESPKVCPACKKTYDTTHSNNAHGGSK